jgi:hypothetical protein
MPSCRMQLDDKTHEVVVNVTDFNRMRWTVAAIRSNPSLRQSLLQVGKTSHLFDSTCLPLLGAQFMVPQHAHVVLWDGLNSLIELQQINGALANRLDLTYLHIGHFHEVAHAYPTSSRPLFDALPEYRPTPLIARDQGIHVPWDIDLRSYAQGLIRPYKNWRTSPQQHQKLKQGGNIVFCGLVRPTVGVIENFFRDSGLFDLKSGLMQLVRVDWHEKLGELERIVCGAYDAIQTAAYQTPTDWSSAYAVLSMLHRMGTLAHLEALTPHLIVNEYGFNPHFDPYDTPAYRANLFIDFGSTRGPDAVYPRTVDLSLNMKQYQSLRFLGDQCSLNFYLKNTSSAGFWELCALHADSLAQMRQRLY